MPTPDLSRVPTIELRRELERRIAQADMIEAKRRELSDELNRIDAEIGALSGGALRIGPVPVNRGRSRTSRRHGNQTSASRTRAANEVSLATAMHNVLKGRTMGIAETADAVRAAGYRSNATNFYTIVNMTLIKRKDLFRRVGRGQYTAR